MQGLIGASMSREIIDWDFDRFSPFQGLDMLDE